MNPDDSSSMSLTVAIIEDDEVVRGSFATLINNTPEMECVGQFSSCEDALDAFSRILPHILLMDIGLPGMSGIEGTRIVKQRHPLVEIVMITVYDDDEKIFQSILAGASGYLLKNAEPQEIIEAIKQIKSGAPMSPSIARRVLGMLKQPLLRRAADFDLTPREDEILHSLVDGLSYKKIADKLFISPLTVHSHIKRIYEKLHVHSRAEAVSKVLRQRPTS